MWGDRITEVVLIGIDMDRSEIENQLDLCLLTAEEMDMDWATFNNPLPWLSDDELNPNSSVVGL
ncbi:putative metal chaperone YciC [compost metagenome]